MPLRKKERGRDRKKREREREKKNVDVDEKRSSNFQLLLPFRLVAIIASLILIMPMSYFLFYM